MSATPIQSTDEMPRTRSVSALLSFDPLLLLAAIGLSVFSIVTIHGAGYGSLAERQGLYAGIGLVAAILITRFDYTVLREFRYVFYGLAIVLNLAVFAFSGTKVAAQTGATRWIPLPFFQFQPSEFGKLLLIVSLAAFAVNRSRRLSERRTLARVMLLALVPAMIVIKQPDLGTGLIYVIAAAAILFFMGVGWKHMTALLALFAIAIALVLAVAPAVGVNVLQGYQKQRLTTFINPPTTCTPEDTTCYQLHQSLIAIGSGEKTGRGAAGATQTRFNFIPEAQDDFIFAVIGETYGFAGAAVVLSLYALLIWRTLRILTMSKNLFGTLIAGGILAMLMFQIFLNIGMTIGVMPVTGVPLPLLSYGGSSVLVTFLALGLLQSIHIQARMSSAGKARVLIV
ncbi:MAG TPA: rod shape-determining protein RodA [Solirubrobacteraceae bacterium]|jgi:rod shape determining protein RodA|nr:rod shape-determining protein RodA [Solirubrobacteraceae bacterium]